MNVYIVVPEMKRGNCAHALWICPRDVFISHEHTQVAIQSLSVTFNIKLLSFDFKYFLRSYTLMYRTTSCPSNI